MKYMITTYKSAYLSVSSERQAIKEKLLSKGYVIDKTIYDPNFNCYTFFIERVEDKVC